MPDRKAKILVFYSSPGDAPPLRLGTEERSLDDVLHELRIDLSLVRRIHATAIEDFTRALQDEQCDLVQFSGHGYEAGILLEDRYHGTSLTVPAEQIAQIVRETSPNLKAVIFLACYSAASIPFLVEAAPYLITITGAADDETAVTFITQFYRAYFKTGSIEHAFNMAQNFLGLAGKTGGLHAVLSRRAIVKGSNRVLFQVFPSGKDKSILLDLTEAENDIASLSLPRDEFLALLSRKIRIHTWVFSAPRQRVVLSLGPYFGLFSWQNADDVVICHRILKVKPAVSEQTCEAWASLIVYYNDHYMAPYRTTAEQNDPLLSIWLPTALKDYFKTYADFFESGEKAELLREQAPDQFKVTKALISANLKMAETKLHQEDHPSVVRYLEATLSAIHDLLDQLTAVLTI